MSYLSKICKPIDRPIICTITGDAGTGKTTLAATFPNPIFIRAEDGLQAIKQDDRPDAFPLLSDAEEIWKQLAALINEENDYKTVVIDSVTQLETMFADYVVSTDPKKPRTLAQAVGGYGAGQVAVAAMHGRVRKAAQMLNELGKHVVFIAHSDVSTIEPPDDDPYTRYDLRLHKKSMTHYVDNVDLVAYLKLETFTMGDGDKKRAIYSGNRIVTCYSSAAQVSKNRYGINEDIKVDIGVNPFIDYIKSLNN